VDFAYLRPDTLAELLQLLQQEGYVAYAGGTDILVRIREGRSVVRALVDIKQIRELGSIAVDENGNIEIGPAVTMSQLAGHPLVERYALALHQAAKVMGCREIQNRATIGGNLANASPSAETAVALLVYDADLEIAGLTRQYSLPLREFFQGPGKTVLQKGEIIRKITISSGNVLGCRSTYLREGRIKGMDLATVSIAVWHKYGAHSCYRVAAGAVLPTPARLGPVEEYLDGLKTVDEESLAQVRGLFAAGVKPRPDSLRGSPLEKKYTGANLLARAVREVTDG
jgi:CO/xanthine dehydrogenase FAD-binding subunit